MHRNRANLGDLLDLGERKKDRAQLAEVSDCIILCVTGTPQVEANVYGGLLEGARKGQIVVDCSTSMPESTDRIRADFEKKGVRFVDAPLARTPQHAEEGKLNCMVGADDKTFAEVKPVLEKFCENIFHVGGPGTGHKIKLVYNFVAMAHAAVTCESLAACARVGISPEKFFQLVSAGGANSNMFQMVVPKALKGELDGLLFSLSNAKKDIGYYQQMVAGHRSPAPWGPPSIRCWCRRTRSASARSSSRLCSRPTKGSTLYRSFNAEGGGHEAKEAVADAGRGQRVLRPVEGAPRVGAGAAEEAAGHRPHHGRERPVRRERHVGAARRHDGDPRVQREGRRARAPHRGAAHRHRDHARDRLARRGAHDHAQRGRVPDRRPELGVANAIGQVAQKYGVVYLNSNSSSPTESGRDCKRVKFVWDGNGTNFAQAIVKNAIKVNGGNWALLTNDYIWGHNTSKATRELVVKAAGWSTS